MIGSWLVALALTGPEGVRVGPIEVAASECGSLDVAELARLLALELGDVTPQMRTGPPLRIELSCAAPTLELAIADPITDKRMARALPLPADEPGRERVIALAIAQLFSASWLELLLPATPTATPRPAPAPPAPAAVTAAREHARARVKPQRSIQLLAAGTVRGRALERAPLVAGGGEFDVRPTFGAAAVIVRIGFEGTELRRRLGTVRTWLVTAGVGVGGRVRVSRRWDLGVAGVASGAVGRVRGIASRPDVPTGRVTALSGQLAMGAGPRVRLGTARLELDAEIGGTLRTPEGLVEGARPVSLGGLWAGAALRVGVELPTPRRGR